MPYSYKHLTTTDVPLLKNLLQVFGQAFNELPTYQNAVPSDTYLQSLLAKPHFIALVAMQANEVVGGLAAYVLEKFEQDRREIYIYDLAISETHRRKGVATSLIKTLQQIANRKTRLHNLRPSRSRRRPRHPPLRIPRRKGIRLPLRHSSRMRLNPAGATNLIIKRGCRILCVFQRVRSLTLNCN